MRGSTSFSRGALGARVISLHAAPFESASPVPLKPVSARNSWEAVRSAEAEALAAGKDRQRLTSSWLAPASFARPAHRAAGALFSLLLPLVMDLAPGRRRSGAFSLGFA